MDKLWLSGHAAAHSVLVKFKSLIQFFYHNDARTE